LIFLGLTIVDSTTQISIWSNIEASLGIIAGSLTVTRPLFRVFASNATSSRSHPNSYTVLSSNRAHVELGEYGIDTGNNRNMHGAASRSETSFCRDCGIQPVQMAVVR
jgi:hypothetical protein